MPNTTPALSVRWTRLGSVGRPDELDRYAQSFPEDTRDRLSRYYRSRDRHASIIGLWLAVEALTALGVEGCEPGRLARDVHGRPYLPDASNADFNIAHSGDVVVCAVSTVGRVGVDVELHRPVALADYREVFPPDIWQQVIQGPDSLSLFYRYWTQLESVVKAEGTAFAGPFQTMRIARDVAEYLSRRWFIAPIAVATEYHCHLASDTAGQQPIVTECGWTSPAMAAPPLA